MRFVVRRPFFAVFVLVALLLYWLFLLLLSFCACVLHFVDKLHVNNVETLICIVGIRKKGCLQIAFCIFNEINKIHIKIKSVLNHTIEKEQVPTHAHILKTYETKLFRLEQQYQQTRTSRILHLQLTAQLHLQIEIEYN